jgi:hypothetical protein
MTMLLSAACLLLATALVVIQLPARGIPRTLVAFGLIAWATVVVQMGIAGLILRDLSGEALRALAVLWLVVVVGLTLRRGALPLRVRDRARASLRTVLEVLGSPIPAFLAVLLVANLAWRTFLALRLPTIDYDGWTYHLVTMDVWLQANALVNVPQKIWSDGYPANGELLTTWIAAFSRTDQLAGLTSLLPLPVAIVAAMGLARALGVSRRTSFIVGALFGLTPALYLLAGTSYVDVAGIAAIAATWWLGLEFLKGRRDGSTGLLLGIAGGLAVGGKLGSNAVLVAPMLLVCGLLALRDVVRSRGSGWRSSPVAALLLLSVPVILLGLSWYIKNLLVHGNPMYPIGFGPFPGAMTLAEFGFTPKPLARQGEIQQVLFSWIWDWRLTRYPFNVRPGGFGLVWIPAMVLAAVGAVALLRRRSFAPFLLIVAPAVVATFTSPGAWYARYTLFLPLIAWPFAGVALEWIASGFAAWRGREAAPESAAQRTAWGRVATVATIGLVALATVSLAIATVRPNLTTRYTDVNDKRHSFSTRGYLEILLEASDERRSRLGLLGDCAGLRVIPVGARVTPAGNKAKLLHAVVGPNLDRILTPPILSAADAADLAAQMRALGSEWLVAGAGHALGRIAATDPALFVNVGTFCREHTLWRLALA